MDTMNYNNHSNSLLWTTKIDTALTFKSMSDLVVQALRETLVHKKKLNARDNGKEMKSTTALKIDPIASLVLALLVPADHVSHYNDEFFVKMRIAFFRNYKTKDPQSEFNFAKVTPLCWKKIKIQTAKDPRHCIIRAILCSLVSYFDETLFATRTDATCQEKCFI